MTFWLTDQRSVPSASDRSDRDGQQVARVLELEVRIEEVVPHLAVVARLWRASVLKRLQT